MEVLMILRGLMAQETLEIIAMVHTSSHPSLFLETAEVSATNHKPAIDTIMNDILPITSQSLEFIERNENKAPLKSDVKTVSPNSVTFSDTFLFNQTNINKTFSNTSIVNDNNKSSSLSDDFKKCVTPPPSYLQVSRATHGYSCLIKSSPLKLFNNQSMGQGESVNITNKRVEFSPGDEHPQRVKVLDKVGHSLDANSSTPVKSSTISRPSRGISCLSPSDKYMLGQRDTSNDNLRVQLRRQRTRSQNMAGESSQYDDSHFQRSSLIMMMVSQSTRQTSNHNIDLASSPIINKSKSLNRTQSHKIRDENEIGPNPNDNNTSVYKNLVKSSTPMKMMNKGAGDKSNNSVLTPLDAVPEFTQNGCLKKNGEYFLQVVAKEQDELLSRAREIEIIIESAEELNNNNNQINDEILGEMRTTVGQAKLLTKEKFEQFRNLCRENLLSDEELTNGLRPLDSDLDGFWALVLIEVDNIKSKMADIESLRRNNWKRPDDSLATGKKINFQTTTTTTRKMNNLEKKKPVIRKDKNDEAQRQAARQRIMAMKKQFQAKKSELDKESQQNDCIILY